MAQPLYRIDGQTGEIELSSCAGCNNHLSRIAALERDLELAEKEIRKQRSTIAAKERDRQRDRDQHKQRADIERIFELWKRECLTRKSAARLNNKRFDLVVARLKEGYEVEHLELAVYGAAKYPYVTKAGKVKREFEFIFADGSLLEEFANKGARAVREAKQEMEGQA